jgi:prepilin-type N-terminal cleavage/methylation domain-containing protein
VSQFVRVHLESNRPRDRRPRRRQLAPCRQSKAREPAAPRRGFTLVELLVAVLLIDVGVLAMVSATTMLARRQVELRTRAAASQLAANRIQRLIAGPCGAVIGTATAATGVTEHWSVTRLPNSVRALRDSVVFAVGGVERRVVVGARSRC